MSDKKSFLGNTLFIQLLNWLVKPLWIFLIDREVQNLLGDEVYGTYQVYLKFCIIFIILIDLGIHNFNTREISRDTAFLRSHFSGLIWFKMILSIAYFGLIISLGYANGLGGFLLLTIGLNQVLNSWILFLRSVITGVQWFKTDGILSVLDRVIAGLLCAVFLFSSSLREKFELSYFIGFQTIAYLIGIVISLILIKKAKADFTFKFPGKEALTSLFKQSWPFALLALLMTLINNLDVHFIHQLWHTAETEVGVYAKSLRFLEATAMYAMLFTGVMYPVFSSMLKRNENVSELLGLAIKLTWIPGILLLVLTWFWGGDMLNALYHYEDESRFMVSQKVFNWHMAMFLPLSLSLIYGTLLTAGGFLKELNLIALSTLVVFSVSAFLLVPSMGAHGAAIALFMGHLVSCICHLLVSRFKMMKLSETINKALMKIIISGILIFTLSYFINQTSFSWLHQCLIISVIYLIILNLTGILKRSHLDIFIKYKKKQN